METLGDLRDAVGGRLLPEGPASTACSAALGPIVTDSRRIVPGEVFWALRGPYHDAAQFTGDAFARGAAGAVVQTPIDVPEGRWALVVQHSYEALLAWARWRRRRFTGTLIAVTGSVGKTTTRQMIHTILQTRLAGTASPRNFNNHWGLPLSMVAIEPHHDYAMLELGASRSGEIAALAELCAPKVGVITAVGDAHLEGFGSRQAIAEAKAELLTALPENGHAVLADDPWLHSVSWRCRAPITWIGTDPGCHLHAVNVQAQDGSLRFCLPLPGCQSEPSTQPFSIPVWGRHHLTAALAAVAVGRMLGFDLAEMAAALAKFQTVPMRCEVLEIRGATVINDTYNSNPTAMEAALKLLRDFAAPGRRIVVCGDMAELGQRSIALHWQLGKQVVELGGADLLIAGRQFARYVTGGARTAGLVRSRAIPCDTADEALPYLGQAMLPGDVVLVKGSRVMGMERVVEALKHYPQRRSA